MKARRGRAGTERARREAFASTAQVEAAERMADALIVAFAKCELAGRPLSELQKIDILSIALASFDGYRAELADQLCLEQILAGLGRAGNGAAAAPSDLPPGEA
jgi:hypothetical protein